VGDDDDDVEGHGSRTVNPRAVGDDDDDVEGHSMRFSASGRGE
jgi:hypothetical protein